MRSWYNDDMSSRVTARRKANNNREYILYSRLACGDCTFCPRHDGENMRGEHSKWGKKKAMRRFYTQGKHRTAPKEYRTGYTYKDLGIVSETRWYYPELFMVK